MTTPDTNISITTPGGMTVADLREFLDYCQRSALPDDTRVTARIRMSGHVKYIEARERPAAK